MAEYTYEDLKNHTVTQLREIAKGLESEEVRGYSTMHKEDLVQAICRALGLDARVHHEVVGVDKKSIKKRIRELKKKRDEVLASGEGKLLKPILRKIHHLKRRIHKATV
jgi:16S rRNA C967 or C1407 C5-methylase (RsmB/RsmF family)